MAEPQFSFGVDIDPLVDKVFKEREVYRKFSKTKAGDTFKLGNCDVTIADKNELVNLSNEDKLIIACSPADTEKPNVPASIAKCCQCHCEVWITDDTKKNMPTHAPIVCTSCMVAIGAKLNK